MEDSVILQEFKKNCENVLYEFEKHKCYSYVQFELALTKTNFKLKTKEYQTENEEKNFMRLYFYHVKKSLVNTESIYAQIGAFYLLYKLYFNCNNFQMKVKILFTLSEFKVLLQLVNAMKHAQNDGYQFLYIFSKMLSNNCFRYVVNDEILLLSGVDTNIDEETPDEAIGTLLRDPKLQKLSNTQDTYQKYLSEYLDKNPDFKITFKKTSNIIKELEELKKLNE